MAKERELRALEEKLIAREGVRFKDIVVQQQFFLYSRSFLLYS